MDSIEEVRYLIELVVCVQNMNGIRMEHKLEMQEAHTSHVLLESVQD